MAKGVIGQPYTFTALFLDANGDPTDVDNPTIEVFTFSDAGERTHLVGTGTALPASTPVETGRYAFTYTVDGSLSPHQQVFAVLRGEDPGSGEIYTSTVVLDLFAEDSNASSCTGVNPHFVKPAGFP